MFINVLLNASQSMPGGGEIHIMTYTEKDEYACLKITDTGAGISEENLEKVFDPFFTTKSDKGMGLGLSVSYGIIERHGGKIEVQSKVNEGTTFTIKLPLSHTGQRDSRRKQPARLGGSCLSDQGDSLHRAASGYDYLSSVGAEKHVYPLPAFFESGSPPLDHFMRGVYFFVQPLNYKYHNYLQ